jgi:hypothetical protein
VDVFFDLRFFPLSSVDIEAPVSSILPGVVQ